MTVSMFGSGSWIDSGYLMVKTVDQKQTEVQIGFELVLENTETISLSDVTSRR